MNDIFISGKSLDSRNPDLYNPERRTSQCSPVYIFTTGELERKKNPSGEKVAPTPLLHIV
jgi:hypothetical protein